MKITPIALTTACSLVLLACGSKVPPPVQQEAQSATNVTYTAQLVQGVPTWVTSAKRLDPGTTVHATLVNTLEDTHGFQVAGVDSLVQVPPSKTVTTTFVLPNQTGSVSFTCPLHSGFQPATHELTSAADMPESRPGRP